MDNYIIPVHKALEALRIVRNAGAKFERVKRGEWKVTYTPAFMIRPKVGDKLLISQMHKGDDIYIIPEPEWMLKWQVQIEPDIRWRVIHFRNRFFNDDENILGYPPPSIS